MTQPLLVFNGPAYNPEHDQVRLSTQFKTIYALMADGQYRTLQEIEGVTGYPQASISAQLRHARKKRFGGHTVERRRRGNEKHGLWEYQLISRDVENTNTKDICQ